MLNFTILKIKFQNFIKNNGLVDFFFKNFSKLFVYNFSIYLAFFFAEKYLIEFTTRYIYNWLLLTSLKLVKVLNWVNMYVYLFLGIFNILVLCI